MAQNDAVDPPPAGEAAAEPTPAQRFPEGITTLADLSSEDRVLIGEAMRRVWAAAPLLLRPQKGRERFNTKKMALAVYAVPPGYETPVACSAHTDCPVDAAGTHAVSAMGPLRIEVIKGAYADDVVVDGLAPSTIIDLKAHQVANTGEDCWDTLVDPETMKNGFTKSFGGVFAVIRLPNGMYLTFVVAASGDDPEKDEQLARALADAIKADLITAGFVPRPIYESDTFIVGLDPEQLARFLLAQTKAAQK